MEHEYKNYFSQDVLNNNVFINKLTKVLKSMKKESHLAVKNDEYKGYIYKDEYSKSSYLILETEDLTEVYCSSLTYQKPFQAFLNGDLNSLKYYSDKVIGIFNSKDIVKKIEEEINAMLETYPENLRSHMKELMVRTMEIPQQSVTNNPYEVKLFLEFLEKNQFSAEFNKEFLLNNKSLYEKVSERVTEFGLVLESTLEALKNNNITEKNKFEYNDLDNHVWKNAQYIVSTEQNFSWVVDFKDLKNFTVYAALAAHNGDGSKAKSTTGLLKKVKSGEKLDLIDYVGLKVENGKVIYANNAFMYSLDFNIMLNKSVLEEEGLLKVDYGNIDVKSFDYQFAYSNKKYGTNKVEFLIHSFFILGNGYSYDEKEGKLYSDVNFIPNLLDNFKYEENEDDKAKIDSLIYLAPQKLKYLDDQWLENLKYIVNKIKEDKPDLSKTHTRIGNDSPEDVLKELDKVIKYNDNLRKNKPKI